MSVSVAFGHLQDAASNDAVITLVMCSVVLVCIWHAENVNMINFG